MIFVLTFVATVAGAVIHLLVARSIPLTRARLVEVVLLYFLCVQFGFGGVLLALPHILVPERIAEYVGWPPGNPFQVELGFASLGLAVLGVLSIWLRGWFWVAPAVGYSIFLLGAAFVHLREIAGHGNLSPGNAGAPLFFDVLVPIVVLTLLAAHIRMGGMKASA
jgi:hypothetical protein